MGTLQVYSYTGFNLNLAERLISVVTRNGGISTVGKYFSIVTSKYNKNIDLFTELYQVTKYLIAVVSCDFTLLDRIFLVDGNSQLSSDVFKDKLRPASSFVFLCYSTMYEEKESPPFNGPSNERFLSGKTFLSFLLALLSARETSTRSALVLMYLATTDKRHSATMLKIYGWQGKRVINTTTKHHRRLYRPILSSFLPSSFPEQR